MSQYMQIYVCLHIYEHKDHIKNLCVYTYIWTQGSYNDHIMHNVMELGIQQVYLRNVYLRNVCWNHCHLHVSCCSISAVQVLCVWVGWWSSGNLTSTLLYVVYLSQDKLSDCCDICCAGSGTMQRTEYRRRCWVAHAVVGGSAVHLIDAQLVMSGTAYQDI